MRLPLCQRHAYFRAGQIIFLLQHQFQNITYAKVCVLYVQEVLAHLYINLLYKMAQDYSWTYRSVYSLCLLDIFNDLMTFMYQIFYSKFQ